MCDKLSDVWGRGRIDLGTLTVESAQYVAGYVTKKMTAADDPRLEGRAPEFALQSKRPGIAADAVPEIASELMRLDLDTSQSDVPVTLRHGSRELPLGRYLRRKIRAQIGKDENTPNEVLLEQWSEMQSVYDREKAAHLAAIEKGHKPVSGELQAKFKNSVLEMKSGKLERFFGKNRVFKKRRSL